LKTRMVLWLLLSRVARSEGLALDNPRMQRVRDGAQQLVTEGAGVLNAVRLARDIEFHERWGQRRRPRLEGRKDQP